MQITLPIKTEHTENIFARKENICQDGYICEKNQNYFTNIKEMISKIIENITSPEILTINDQINNKFLELDFGAEFASNATKISQEDAIFFLGILKENNIISYNIENNDLTLNFDDKKINTSNSLINMLKTSIDNKKPIRLDFDNDITVILKLDKEGKIQAHFIPGTSEVQNYLKNNLSSLKQRFDEENINYSHLGYSKHKEDENQKNKKRSNK